VAPATIAFCSSPASAWAKRDPLAKEAFASQLAVMKTFNVGYISDSMLVDVDGKTKLTLSPRLRPVPVENLPFRVEVNPVSARAPGYSIRPRGRGGPAGCSRELPSRLTAPEPAPQSTPGMRGLRCAQGRAASRRAAAPSTAASPIIGPMTWTATGSPSPAQPAGTLMAGWPVMLKG
jgi:hypothetical protein